MIRLGQWSDGTVLVRVPRDFALRTKNIGPAIMTVGRRGPDRATFTSGRHTFTYPIWAAKIYAAQLDSAGKPRWKLQGHEDLSAASKCPSDRLLREAEALARTKRLPFMRKVRHNEHVRDIDWRSALVLIYQDRPIASVNIDREGAVWFSADAIDMAKDQVNFVLEQLLFMDLEEDVPDPDNTFDNLALVDSLEPYWLLNAPSPLTLDDEAFRSFIETVEEPASTTEAMGGIPLIESTAGWSFPSEPSGLDDRQAY